MAHKVVFRDDAVADLTALYDYIADNNSPEIAIEYIRRIQEACTRAAMSPDTPLATTVGEPGIFAVVTHDRTVGWSQSHAQGRLP